MGTIGTGPRPNAGESPLVALRLESGSAFARELLTAWENGRAVLPMDPKLPQPAVKALLDLLKPSLLIDQAGQTALEGGVWVGSDVAVVMPTSGTTGGRPKAVELTHSALGAAAVASRLRLGHSADEQWMCCLPLTHIAGLMVLVRAREAGSLPVIHDRFEVEAVRTETRTTLLSLVPTALAKLFKAEVDLSHYSTVLLGGAPIPGDLLDESRRRDVRVVTSYGMTETAGGCVYDGIPLDGVEIELAREQILIRGPVLFSRYRLDEDLTAHSLKKSWFHTADRGKVDENGKLRVLGRMDDLIITGGENVSPTQVEEILEQHPAISEAAVTGLPSKTWGQKVAAAIVLNPGKQITLQEIRTHVSSKSKKTQAPKTLAIVKAIPKTKSGKIKRSALPALFLTP
ncbi:MAG: class I adenylate-forming enzyme family protein [Actinomycetota bacterium]